MEYLTTSLNEWLPFGSWEKKNFLLPQKTVFCLERWKGLNISERAETIEKSWIRRKRVENIETNWTRRKKLKTFEKFQDILKNWKTENSAVFAKLQIFSSNMHIFPRLTWKFVVFFQMKFRSLKVSTRMLDQIEPKWTKKFKEFF